MWAALTTADGIASWFGDTARIDGVRVGASGSLGWEDFGDYAFVVTAVVDEFLFEFRWAKDPGVEVLRDNATSVRFVLMDAPNGTILTLVESGFDALPGDETTRRELLHGNGEGWNLELDELVRVLESSAPRGGPRP